MPFILLQNPDSNLAGELDALVNWSGIYYAPEQAAPAGSGQPRSSAVVMCDCGKFAPELLLKWWSRLTPNCQVLALVDENYNLQQLNNCQQLMVVLPAGINPALIRQNLHLADRVMHSQLAVREQLSNCQRQLEETGLIWQAKKWIMRQWGLSEEQAHRWLQHQSQVKQQKLINTARQIMQGYYLGRPLPKNAQTISDKPKKE